MADREMEKNVTLKSGKREFIVRTTAGKLTTKMIGHMYQVQACVCVCVCVYVCVCVCVSIVKLNHVFNAYLSRSCSRKGSGCGVR